MLPSMHLTRSLCQHRYLNVVLQRILSTCSSAVGLEPLRSALRGYLSFRWASGLLIAFTAAQAHG